MRPIMPTAMTFVPKRIRLSFDAENNSASRMARPKVADEYTRLWLVKPIDRVVTREQIREHPQNQNGHAQRGNVQGALCPARGPLTDRRVLSGGPENQCRGKQRHRASPHPGCRVPRNLTERRHRVEHQIVNV